jgi:hypothetical protein
MVHNPIRATRLPMLPWGRPSPNYNLNTRAGLLGAHPHLMQNLLQPPPGQSVALRAPRHLVPIADPMATAYGSRPPTADPMATAYGGRPPAADPMGTARGGRPPTADPMSNQFSSPPVPPPPPGPAGPAIATPADKAEAGARLAQFAKNLGAMGPSLIAAGATTTDPSASGRYKAEAAQKYREAVEASKVTELARQQRGAISRMAVKLGLAPNTPAPIVMEAMKAKTAAGKFGPPTVIADPKSSTGYARIQVAQDGTIRNLGAAKPPTRMFDTDAALKKAGIDLSIGRYEKATQQIDEADKITADVSQMMSLVNRVDSGTLADTKLSIRKFLSAVGIQQDMTKIADAEAMKAKGMGFVLSLIQKTKGAISEKEMEAFKKASAGLENTPEGNTMILALSQKIADRMKFEAEAVRREYKPGISAKELDDIRFAARKEFGSVVPPAPPKGFK